jgi:hypothetical protein
VVKVHHTWYRTVTVELVTFLLFFPEGAMLIVPILARVLPKRAQKPITCSNDH